LNILVQAFLLEQMLKSLFFNNRSLIICTSLVCLFSGTLLQNQVIYEDDFVALLPHVTASKEELLDQIFEEAKSDRLCRFIKTRRLKV